MTLPKHIAVEDSFWYKRFGLRYSKEAGTDLFADMNGGWLPEELEAIAQDIRERVAKRKKP